MHKTNFAWNIYIYIFSNKIWKIYDIGACKKENQTWRICKYSIKSIYKIYVVGYCFVQKEISFCSCVGNVGGRGRTGRVNVFPWLKLMVEWMRKGGREDAGQPLQFACLWWAAAFIQYGALHDGILPQSQILISYEDRRREIDQRRTFARRIRLLIVWSKRRKIK